MVPELAELLTSYHPLLRPTSPPEPLLAGLSGARLWAFETPTGRLVARAWPRNMRPDRLAQIHAWLEYERPLPIVAAPQRDLESRTFRIIHGHCWEIMPWKPGTPDLLDRPDPARLAAAGSGLASFHARLEPFGRQGPSPGLTQRVDELSGLVKGGLDRLDAAVRKSPATPLREPALEWLRSSRPAAESLLRVTLAIRSQTRPLQPCLRDARPEHFLFQGTELTGLIDFGAMATDTIALDLARLLQEIPRIDKNGRRTLLEGYQKARPLDPGTLQLIDQLTTPTQFLVTARWLAWHYLQNSPIATETTVTQRLRWQLNSLNQPDNNAQELDSTSPRT